MALKAYERNHAKLLAPYKKNLRVPKRDVDTARALLVTSTLRPGQDPAAQLEAAGRLLALHRRTPNEIGDWLAGLTHDVRFPAWLRLLVALGTGDVEHAATLGKHASILARHIESHPVRSFDFDALPFNAVRQVRLVNTGKVFVRKPNLRVGQLTEAIAALDRTSWFDAGRDIDQLLSVVDLDSGPRTETLRVAAALGERHPGLAVRMLLHLCDADLRSSPQVAGRTQKLLAQCAAALPPAELRALCEYRRHSSGVLSDRTLIRLARSQDRGDRCTASLLVRTDNLEGPLAAVVTSSLGSTDETSWLLPTLLGYSRKPELVAAAASALGSRAPSAAGLGELLRENSLLSATDERWIDEVAAAFGPWRWLLSACYVPRVAACHGYGTTHPTPTWVKDDIVAAPWLRHEHREVAASLDLTPSESDRDKALAVLSGFYLDPANRYVPKEGAVITGLEGHLEKELTQSLRYPAARPGSAEQTQHLVGWLRALNAHDVAWLVSSVSDWDADGAPQMPAALDTVIREALDVAEVPVVRALLLEALMRRPGSSLSAPGDATLAGFARHLRTEVLFGQA